MSVVHTASFALPNPLTSNDLIALLGVIIDGLIRLAIPITVIMIIWAAVLYITSRGGDAIKTATKALIWAIIGFGVLLISKGIILIIEDFLGVKPAPHDTPLLDTQGPKTFADILKILTDLSGWLFTFAIIAGVAMIIVAGLYYIFARGDEQRAGRALRVLLYAVVGIAVAALAWAIINIVAQFLTGNKIFVSMGHTVFAASTPITAARPPNAPTGGPQTIKDIYTLVQDLVGWLYTFTIVIGVALIIIAGIRYLFAGGDSNVAKSAGKMLLYGIVGIAIAALAWAIVNLVGNFFVGTPLLLPNGTSVTTTYKCVGGLNDGNTYASNDLCKAQCPANGGTCQSVP